MDICRRTLETYGATPEAIRWFADDDPALLPYATLLSARRGLSASLEGDIAPLVGVYEWQNSPLMFLVDGDKLQDVGPHLLRLRRKLALRGDAPYLGVIRPGSLTILALSLDRKKVSDSLVPLEVATTSPRTTFAYLAAKRPWMAKGRRTWISDILLTLLDDSIQELRLAGVEPEEAISLAGRALFLRFLGDRSLLPSSLLAPKADPATLVENSDRLEDTSRWLDDTFNGDILPVSPTVFKGLHRQAFGTLQDILRIAPRSQLYLGWQKKWDFLDFSHIPVGVLSQAYEQFMRKYFRQEQKQEGVFYTPWTVASLMVRAAFEQLRNEGKAHTARVLDPAAGAGVFLLASFCQLVAERWTHSGTRPDTGALREILYGQLVGFDINEVALRFAALGLYLMAIELDPNPEPVTKLRFAHNLRDRVLLKWTGRCVDGDLQKAQENNRILGSLGPEVPSEHVARYDLVVGNPPWPTGTQLPDWLTVKKIVNGIAERRLGADKMPASLLPNECLDLPFVWRAMEWARPGGQIAFALHARVLFQQGDGMPDARRAIFQALDVTGLVNGAEVRTTRVWPEISAPFCLFFARNDRPGVASGFRFVSPRLEPALNGAGVLRIDAANAEIVTIQDLETRPEIFKILFRGTRLDLEVFERMAQASLTPLRDCWGSLFGWCRGRPRQTGNGYQRLRDSSEKKEDLNEPGVSSAYLKGMQEVTIEAMQGLRIDRDNLIKFEADRFHRRRPHNIFKGPLVIVHESPPAESGRIRTGATDEDTVYNQSYYGYSAANHPQGATWVRYVALLIASKPALWWVLMTSGRFGVEREAIEKSVIDSMPVVPLDNLDNTFRSQIDSLFEEIARDGSEESWKKVDAWAASLYGLRPEDLQVIADTLKYNLPFAKNKADAQAYPTKNQRSDFMKTLAAELRLWAEDGYDDVLVEPVEIPETSPWLGLRVRGFASGSSPNMGEPAFCDWQPVLQLADVLGAAEVLSPGGPGEGLWIARLAQARYWSRSQARLVARRIIWNHLDDVFAEEI